MRRKNVLRGAGYAWTPVLVSFFKLLEVGFSPYLGFIPIFSTFRMFESIEAIRGRLIGLKPWDRFNVKILKPNGAARGCSMTDDGVKWFVLGVNHVLIGFEAGSGREMRVHNVNR